MSLVKEHEMVVLTADLPGERLAIGDVGTVVHVHKGGEAYEVEFLTLTGATVAVVSVAASQLRAVDHRDVSHARRVA